MSEHADLLEIAELYGLGGLGDSERAQLEQHVADGCGECEAVLRANLDIAGALLLASAPVQPSPVVRQRLLARARNDGDVGSAKSAAPGRATRGAARSTRGRLAAVAAAVLLLGSWGYAALLGARLAQQNKTVDELEDLLVYEESISWALVRETERERSQRVALENRLQRLSRIVAAIEAPLARSLALAGQGDFHRAQAKAYIEPVSGRLILYAHNLPPVPDGRTYQIWVIVGDRSRSAGAVPI